MELLHRTSDAEAILASGFTSSHHSPRRAGARRGIWFANTALQDEHGTSGDCWLMIDVPDDRLGDLDLYEVSEGHGRFREWLIPFDVANDYGRPKTVRRISDMRD